jgi:hypothetical protein
MNVLKCFCDVQNTVFTILRWKEKTKLWSTCLYLRSAITLILNSININQQHLTLPFSLCHTIATDWLYALLSVCILNFLTLWPVWWLYLDWSMYKGGLVQILFCIPSLWIAPFPQPLLLRSYISPPHPCFVTSALKMETACFSKMLDVTYKTTWRQNPKQHQYEVCILVTQRKCAENIYITKYIVH